MALEGQMLKLWVPSYKPGEHEEVFEVNLSTML